MLQLVLNPLTSSLKTILTDLLLISTCDGSVTLVIAHSTGLTSPGAPSSPRLSSSRGGSGHTGVSLVPEPRESCRLCLDWTSIDADVFIQNDSVNSRMKKSRLVR